MMTEQTEHQAEKSNETAQHTQASLSESTTDKQLSQRQERARRYKSRAIEQHNQAIYAMSLNP